LFPFAQLHVALTKEDQKIVFRVLIYVSEANGKLLEDNTNFTKTVFIAQNHQGKANFRCFHGLPEEISMQRKELISANSSFCVMCKRVHVAPYFIASTGLLGEFPSTEG
jgi:hypothetical protein